jgi:hypothetical protein
MNNRAVYVAPTSPVTLPLHHQVHVTGCAIAAISTTPTPTIALLVLSVVTVVPALPFQAAVRPTPMVLVTTTQAVTLAVVAMSSQAILLTLLLTPVIGHVIAASTQMDPAIVLYVPRLTLVVLVIHLL